MKPTKYVKRNKFKEYLKESWSVYLVVLIVLSVIGVIFSASTGGGNILLNVISIVLGILFVISFMMLIEFLIWKKKN